MTPVFLQHCRSPHRFTHDTNHVAPVLLAVSSMLLRLPLGLNGFLSVKSYFPSHLLGGPTVPTPLEPQLITICLGSFELSEQPFPLSCLLACLFVVFLLQQEGMVLTQKERLHAIIQHSHLG